MNNLIKISIFEDKKKINGKVIRIMNMKNLEENILNYNSWLKINHREDRFENYEEFLQAK